MKFKRGEKVVYIPEGNIYDFGYLNKYGEAVVYEEGCSNMEDSWCVNVNKLRLLKKDEIKVDFSDVKRVFNQLEREYKTPKLTLKDVIDILADYSIKHVDELEDIKGAYFGKCNPANRTIYICDKQDVPERRDTIIHEFYHAFARRTASTLKEKQIRKLSKELYNELYRVDINEQKETKKGTNSRRVAKK